MEFRVLTTKGSDLIEWESLLTRLPASLRDIHFIPAYGRIYHASYGQDPFLAVCHVGQSFVCQPFVKRRLNDLPFLANCQESCDFYDIANPYGYGGPIVCAAAGADVPSLVAAYEEELTSFALHSGYASEFSSFHPLLRNHELFLAGQAVTPQVQKQIVYMELQGGEEAIWAGLNRGHKSAVNKARRSGVEVHKVEPTVQNIEKFSRLYYRTMERNRAAERWHFPVRYFSDCLEQLGESKASLFFANVGNEVAAAHLLMHDFDTAYYHFGGSDERFNDLRASTLLIYECALWASQQGYHHFHLGGGVSAGPDDNLFRFKSGFSPKTAPLYCYGRILNDSVYSELTTLKREFEVQTLGQEMTSDYFPLYRR